MGTIIKLYFYMNLHEFQVKFHNVCLSACMQSHYDCAQVVLPVSYALGFKCWQIQHPYLLEEWLYHRPIETDAYCWDYVGYHRY